MVKGIYSSDQITENINRIKRSNPRAVSNLIAGKLAKDTSYEAIISINALCYIFPDQLHKRNSVYYIGTDIESIISILTTISGDDIVCDYFSREADDPFEKMFIDAGFKKYSTYIRFMETYIDNPYLTPEEGKRKILYSMYDPSMCEYASESDIPELILLNNNFFVEYVDDFFSDDDWIEIINKKECMLYREDGKIVTFCVFRIEGKKLYINMILNLGTANLSYNIERRIFEDAWDKGVRCIYYWIRIDNEKALKRNGIELNLQEAGTNRLYNYVYCL